MSTEPLDPTAMYAYLKSAANRLFILVHLGHEVLRRRADTGSPVLHSTSERVFHCCQLMDGECGMNLCPCRVPEPAIPSASSRSGGAAGLHLALAARRATQALSQWLDGPSRRSSHRPAIGDSTAAPTSLPDGMHVAPGLPQDACLASVPDAATAVRRANHVAGRRRRRRREERRSGSRRHWARGAGRMASEGRGGCGWCGHTTR